MLMFFFLIITALFVMQLEERQQLKQIVRDSCTCIIMYLNVITKNCVSVVSAMSSSSLLLLPKMNESRKTSLVSGTDNCRNNAGISIISTTSR